MVDPIRSRPDTAASAPVLRALLAGGGTGGHVFPALAVAEELARRGVEVTFAGSEAGLEARLVAERSLPFVALPARPLLGRGPLAKLRSLATLLRSTLVARRELVRRAIDVVVGTGGYASAPAVLGARLARVPSLIVEPNATAGLANRWLSRWASAAAVGYAATVDELQCPAEVTGVPVREAFFAQPEASVPSAGEPLCILVLGGSQGSRQLNLTVPPALGRLEAEGALPRCLVVHHQAGPERLDEAWEAYEEVGLESLEMVAVVPFVDDVATVMGEAHLVISRAGALTTAEICAAGRASLLVPLAIAAGHQVANARQLTDAGAARLVDPRELTPEKLAAALGELLADPERLAVAGRAARRLARRDAVRRLADKAEELAAERSRHHMPAGGAS